MDEKEHWLSFVYVYTRGCKSTHMIALEEKLAHTNTSFSLFIDFATHTTTNTRKTRQPKFYANIVCCFHHHHLSTVVRATASGYIIWDWNFCFLLFFVVVDCAGENNKRGKYIYISMLSTSSDDIYEKIFIQFTEQSRAQNTNNELTCVFHYKFC